MSNHIRGKIHVKEIFKDGDSIGVEAILLDDYSSRIADSVSIKHEEYGFEEGPKRMIDKEFELEEDELTPKEFENHVEMDLIAEEEFFVFKVRMPKNLEDNEREYKTETFSLNKDFLNYY